MDAVRPEQAVPVCRGCLSEAVLIKARKGGLCDKASGVFLCAGVRLFVVCVQVRVL